MAFWIGILVAVAFVRFAIKIGFYETWAFTFNIVISIYLAIFLGPTIASIPALAETPHCNILAMIGTAIAVFLILHGISYTFITGQFSISFPKILDKPGAGFLGFAAGFLIWSFISFSIYITPISQNTFVKKIGFGSQSQQASISYISWWCNRVNTVVSSQDNKYTTEEMMDGLLKSVKRQTQDKTARQAPATKPSKPAEPNDVKTTVSGEK